MDYKKIKSKVALFHNQGKTKDAANWILKKYNLEDHNLKGFEFREKAEPSMIVMTTEGDFGQQQIIRIPENTFEFPLPLMISLISHEMVHIRQKTRQPYVLDKNEREWQAYYEMLFNKIFPQLPSLTNFHKKAFANKAFDYYNRMGEGSELQLKYAEQKKEVENLIVSIS
ncbi:hypothetical protein [Flavobacterium sp.]|uniref:hypothetical protein n=1 Tax=Flavobacterium sp. TaxID=239 RepID=UPI003750E083